MNYVFDPEVLKQVSSVGIGKPHPEMFRKILDELEKHYPGRIHHEEKWLFNNAGGAMGMMSILYASLSEYLMFFGSPTGTSGHTGRYHFVEDYAYIIDGEFWYAREGVTVREIYKPGDLCKLSKGEIRHYKIPENGWILEYARGYIPTMVPFGLLEVLTSTLDWRLAIRTMGVYSRHVADNILK